MTREEAVNALANLKRYISGGGAIDRKANEAINMAISALSVPDTDVGDIISRQDALDALWKAWCEYEDDTKKKFQESEELDDVDWFLLRIFIQIDRNTILNLPSAQPEIIRCKDCKWKQGAECVMFADVRPFPDDFCSRAERGTND